MNNKKEKVSLVCYIIASISFYIAAILELLDKKSSNGIINICLGSTFLCLSTTCMNKKKK